MICFLFFGGFWLRNFCTAKEGRCGWNKKSKHLHFCWEAAAYLQKSPLFGYVWRRHAWLEISVFEQFFLVCLNEHDVWTTPILQNELQWFCLLHVFFKLCFVSSLQEALLASRSRVARPPAPRTPTLKKLEPCWPCSQIRYQSLQYFFSAPSSSAQPLSWFRGNTIYHCNFNVPVVSLVHGSFGIFRCAPLCLFAPSNSFVLLDPHEHNLGMSHLPLQTRLASNRKSCVRSMVQLGAHSPLCLSVVSP